jgi:hypothetical protein
MVRIREYSTLRVESNKTELTWWDGHSYNLTTHLLVSSPVTNIRICDQCFQEVDQSHKCCGGGLSGLDNKDATPPPHLQLPIPSPFKITSMNQQVESTSFISSEGTSSIGRLNDHDPWVLLELPNATKQILHDETTAITWQHSCLHRPRTPPFRCATGAFKQLIDLTNAVATKGSQTA